MSLYNRSICFYFRLLNKIEQKIFFSQFSSWVSVLKINCFSKKTLNVFKQQMKIWQLSTKANNYVKDRLFWRPSFLWHSVSVCVCVGPAGSYIMKKKPQTLLRQTRTIFHNLFFFHADFGGRSTSDCVFQCLEKIKLEVGGGVVGWRQWFDFLTLWKDHCLCPVRLKLDGESFWRAAEGKRFVFTCCIWMAPRRSRGRK